MRGKLKPTPQYFFNHSIKYYSMVTYITPEIKERIKAKADILELTSQYIKLKRVGNKYFGLCPFHNEKSPSFCVTPSKQIYKCFGCGKGGDIIEFIKEIGGLTYVEAIEVLAKEYSIDINSFSATSKPLQMPKTIHPSVLQPEPTFINETLVQKSLSHYEYNNFVKYLKSIFPEPTVKHLIERFKIGTSKHWDGANVFWYVDESDNTRYGKVMIYDPITGKRDKTRFQSVHRLLKIEYPVFSFYGLHQITTEPKNKAVAIVESEKTAIIMSAFFPSFIWIATGGESNLKINHLKPLTGRNIVLFPDTGNAFNLWSTIAKEAKETLKLNVVVSDYLERFEMGNNSDLEDLAKMGNWFTQFQNPPEPKARPLSIEERTLQDMTARQPLITDMIQRLGLVSIRKRNSL